ncbi:MAG: FMN-binding glutamate synthase family protein, partial [Planctomycetota bacterium]
GGVARFHLETGADLIWQLGTGYFGARAADGTFDADSFRERAAHDSVRMIELKLSQGAKPGHGGILPGHKVTAEIASARGVAIGEACLSPPGHSAFSTPDELVAFVDRLRELSGGKPVGVKLCVGLPHELVALVKAMHAAGSGPDFIAVDGGEGGTGAAPPEFSDHVGMPLEEALVLARNALVGAGIKERVALVAAGKVTSAMDMLRLFALGADATYSARAFMMSVGCIQAQLCHTNACPAGVATQDPGLNRGLDPEDKGARAARFHDDTLATLMELTGALGLEDPRHVTPERVFRRVSVDETRSLAEIHRFENDGALLEGDARPGLLELWRRARTDTWSPSA